MRSLVTCMQGKIGDIPVNLEVKTEEWGMGTRLDKSHFSTEAHLVAGEGRERVYDDYGISPYQMHHKAILHLERQGFRRLGTKLNSGVPTEEVRSTGRRESVLESQGRELYAGSSRQ